MPTPLGVYDVYTLAAAQAINAELAARLDEEARARGGPLFAFGTTVPRPDARPAGPIWQTTLAV
jgi:hypothetical protein